MYKYHMLIALIIYHVKINLQIKCHIYLVFLYYSNKIQNHNANVVGDASVILNLHLLCKPGSACDVEVSFELYGLGVR